MGLTKITSQNLSSGIDPILLGSGTVDFSKLDYLKNVTSDIQTQINSLGGGPGGGDGNLASYTGGMGFLTYTSTGVYTLRLLSTGSNKVSITNNNGSGGNPIFDINESNLSLNNLGSILSITKGGTGSDLGDTSGFLYQSTTGSNVITRILTSGDIPNQINAVKIADGSINNTTFQQLSGVTSNIQQQINTVSVLNTGIVSVLRGGAGVSLLLTSGFLYQPTLGGNITPRILLSDDLPDGISALKIGDGSISDTEFQYLDSVSANIQTQLNSGVKINDTRLSRDLDHYQRCLSSPFNSFVNAVTTKNQAYFVFLGRTPEEKLIKNVNFTINTSGRGTQTAEVGLFSTSLPPCKSGLVFTKLTFSNAITNMEGGSPKLCQNITEFVNTSGYLVASGIYLWAGYRVSMVTTQPSVRQISAVDNGQGYVQIQASAPSFTGNIAGWSGTIQAASVTTLGPYLSANMD